MGTTLVEPKLKLGGSRTPVGLEVIAAVSVTLPTKLPDGNTVIVDVLPVVAPAVTVTAVPLIVKPAVPDVDAALTVSAMVVDAVTVPDVPVTVIVAEPVAAVLVAVRVSTLLALKAAVTPLGKPVAAIVTGPVNPPTGVTVMPSVALLL